MTQRAGLVLS